MSNTLIYLQLYPHLLLQLFYHTQDHFKSLLSHISNATWSLLNKLSVARSLQFPYDASPWHSQLASVYIWSTFYSFILLLTVHGRMKDLGVILWCCYLEHGGKRRVSHLSGLWCGRVEKPSYGLASNSPTTRHTTAGNAVSPAGTQYSHIMVEKNSFLFLPSSQP